LTKFPGPVFGIFDGHAGIVTAEFLVKNLIKTISSLLKQKGFHEEFLEKLRKILKGVYL
jgi:serine/threonine protein phosphatase PrpC